MRLWAYKVKLHMKSGAAIDGYVWELAKTGLGNELRGLKWEGSMPFYFNLDEISAVVLHRVINWRKLFRG